MKKMSPNFLTAFLLSISFFASLFTFPTPTFAATCSPEHSVMYVVAHQDDSLLFQSPDLLHDIQSSKCTFTLFVTAGDAGSGESYWLSREAGARASYAQMKGAADSWAQSDAGVAGHPIPVFTLASHPNISVAFLRLPDGGVDGGGLSNPVSIKKLWEGSISSLTTIDNTSSYTKQDLVDTFAVLYATYLPSRINTQNYLGTFGNADHSDHVATGFFSYDAHKQYRTLHTIHAYEGYESLFHERNVFGNDLDSKIQAFFAYTPFDPHACQTYEACAGAYDEWLNRQYTTGSESGGITPTPTPTNSCQTVVSDTTDTVSTGGNAVATFVPSSWTAYVPGATWIWSAFHVTNPAQGETITFTKQFTATGTITSAKIIIAADDFFAASLNGQEFGASKEFTNYLAGYERSYDVTSLVQAGTNTLTIAVENIPTGDTDPTMNPGGLRYRLDIKKTNCSDPVIPDQPENPGTGSGSSPAQLKISGQKSQWVASSGTMRVTWKTSRASFGHVVYGVDTGKAYKLDLNTPNFGYPNSAPTDPSVKNYTDQGVKTKTHTIELTGLIPGKKYRYRLVSHASPAVTSQEGFFTVPVAYAHETTTSDDENKQGDNSIVITEEVSGDDNATITASSTSTTEATVDSTSTAESSRIVAAVAGNGTLRGDLTYTTIVFLIFLAIAGSVWYLRKRS